LSDVTRGPDEWTAASTQLDGQRQQPGQVLAIAQLVVMHGDVFERIVPIDRAEFAIGRHSENDLVLASQKVSRHHARVLRASDGYLIEDLGSRNGIRLNGKKLAGRSRHPLRNRDALQMSDYRLLFLHVDENGELDRLATIHLDRSEIRQEVNEAMRQFVPDLGGDESE
jgi:pSer/pThr/pTyr-binding forkhead associated (FHA) protein